MRGALAGLLLLAAWPAFAQDPPPPRPEMDHTARPEAKPEAPPEASAPAASETQPANEKVENAGPPVRETLREDDFHYSACLLDLSLIGADYSEMAPLAEADAPDCGIARPILLRAPLPGIEIPGGAPMRCETAWHLAHWLKDFVRPASALLPGQPRITAIEPGTTYQCRQTVGNGGGKLSEHAFGNAFDIAGFRFKDGTKLEIAPRQDSGDMDEAFQRAITGAACLHFTTVLSPGSNAAHENHLHLDIKARKGGWRLCQ